MIQGMTSPELSCSISHNFIVQMIPHHRAAIEMSHNLLCYTTDIALQNIAVNTIITKIITNNINRHFLIILSALIIFPLFNPILLAIHLPIIIYSYAYITKLLSFSIHFTASKIFSAI